MWTLIAGSQYGDIQYPLDSKQSSRSDITKSKQTNIQDASHNISSHNPCIDRCSQCIRPIRLRSRGKQGSDRTGLDIVLTLVQARQVPVSFNSTSTTAPSSSATLNTTLGGVNGAGSGQSGTMTSGAQGGMQLYLSAGLVSVLIAGVVLL